jgi:hypothetical protein
MVEKNQKWMVLLRDYMIENRIHHTFWCINPNSGDTGGLLGNDWSTWDEEKYGLFEKSLWKTSGGKYIGLDHQVPLGKNGISLGEYYNTPNVTPVKTPTPAKTPTPSVNTPTPSSSNVVKGDINGDKVFDSLDFGSLRLYLLGFRTPDYAFWEKAADMDGNGEVDSIDFAFMRKLLLGQI